MSGDHDDDTNSKPAVQLNVRNNSLNLIRVVLAAAVLFSHCFPITGRGEGPLLRGQNYGTWAVYTFFAISGYLITASRMGNPAFPYLVKRIVRIFPGYTVCNIFVAFVIAPIAWLKVNGSLDGLFGTSHSPVDYVVKNATLHMSFYDISGSPAGSPLSGVWNGSLWSLSFEFMCYLMLGAILTVRFFRHRIWMIVAFIAALAVWIISSDLPRVLVENYEFMTLAELAPWFFGGSMVYALRTRIRFDTRGALIAVVGIVGLCAASARWGPQAAAPLVGYLVLYLSSVIPSPRFIQRHDVSYGFYIYAFAIQQFLYVLGMGRDVFTFFLLSAFLTTVCATASWFCIERPALSFATASLGRRAKQAKSVG